MSENSLYSSSLKPILLNVIGHIWFIPQEAKTKQINKQTGERKTRNKQDKQAIQCYALLFGFLQLYSSFCPVL